MEWVAIVVWLLAGHSYELRQELRTAADCRDYVLYLSGQPVPGGSLLRAECTDGEETFWPLGYE